MIELRYHLGTIVGIFLSLGLGMLIGTQLADEGTLVEEHTRLVGRIEESLERLRSEKQELGRRLDVVQQRLAREERFVDDVIGGVVVDVLVGQTVLLYAGDGGDAAGRVQRTLERAGAVVYEADAGVDVDALAAHDAERIVVLAATVDDDAVPDWWERLPTGAVVALPGAVESGPDWPTQPVRAYDSPDGLLRLVERLRGGVGDEETVGPSLTMEELLWERLAR